MEYIFKLTVTVFVISFSESSLAQEDRKCPKEKDFTIYGAPKIRLDCTEDEAISLTSLCYGASDCIDAECNRIEESLPNCSYLYPQENINDVCKLCSGVETCSFQNTARNQELYKKCQLDTVNWMFTALKYKCVPKSEPSIGTVLCPRSLTQDKEEKWYDEEWGFTGGMAAAGLIGAMLLVLLANACIRGRQYQRKKLEDAESTGHVIPSRTIEEDTPDGGTRGVTNKAYEKDERKDERKKERKGKKADDKGRKGKKGAANKGHDKVKKETEQEKKRWDKIDQMADIINSKQENPGLGKYRPNDEKRRETTNPGLGKYRPNDEKRREKR